MKGMKGLLCAGRCAKIMMYCVSSIILLVFGALIGALFAWFLPPRQTCSIQPEIKETAYARCDFKHGPIDGAVHFSDAGAGELKIWTNITDIPLGPHGFHIHEFGVPADGDCTKCGGHYNPKEANHGAPSDSDRHVGDLGNIDVTSKYTAAMIFDSVASLWGRHSIGGRSIVIHEGEDDLGTQDNEGSKTTGNAGKRLACCTIYVVNH